MAKLSKSQQEVWDRLKYVPPPKREPWAYSASNKAPPNPSNGSIYYDTSLSVMRIYDGTQWKIVK